MERANGGESNDERLADLIELAIFSEGDQGSDTVPATGSDLTEFLPVIQKIRKLAKSDAQFNPLGESTSHWPFIGKYRVTALLGRGGQSVVFLAIDPDLERRVVLKLYYGEHDENWVDTLFNEGRLLARIQCRYVARCIAIERVAGLPYLVLEYIPGQSLDNIIVQGPLSVGMATKLIAKIAVALAEIHAHGLVHGDLKPANIVVGSDGDPRIVDFGLSSYLIPTSQMLRGTAAYMAPELTCGEITKPDLRTDIYSLGVVLYEMLTRETPQTGLLATNSNSTFVSSQVTPPERLNPNVPAAISKSCLRCLAPRSERYLSVAEFLADLRPKRPAARYVVGAGLTAALLVALWIWMANSNRPRTTFVSSPTTASTSSSPSSTSPASTSPASTSSESPPASSSATSSSAVPITLGDEWSLGGWLQTPVTGGAPLVALVGNGEKTVPIICQVVSGTDAPVWLGMYDRRLSPSFQNSGFDLRSIPPGRHYVTAVGIPQTDGDPGMTKFFVDGTLVGSTGSTDSQKAGAQTMRELIHGMSTSDAAVEPRFPIQRLEELRVDNRQRTDAEVRDLFSLVGHWQFENNLRNGSLQADRHHGIETVGQDSFQQGQDKYGLALALTPASGALSNSRRLELNPSLQLGPESTISVWYQAPLLSHAEARDNPYITLTKSSGGSKVDCHIIAKWEDDGMVLRLGQRVQGADFIAVPGFDLVAAGGNAAGWHHLAAVGVEGQTSYYLDGRPVGAIASHSQTDVKYVGSDPDAGGNRFANAIDDLRIYRRALSALEIRDLHGLVGHWRFEEDFHDFSSHPQRQTLSPTLSTTAAATPLFVAGRDTAHRMAVRLEGTAPLILSKPIPLGRYWTIAAWFRTQSPPKRQFPPGKFNVLTRSDRTEEGFADSQIAVSKSLESTLLGYHRGTEIYPLQEFSLRDLSVGWHHVAAVGSGGKLTTYYFDGVRCGSLDVQSQTNVAFIGSDRRPESPRFSEAIDDLRIYNCSLGAAEIRDLVGLVAHWQFEGDGRDTSPASSHHDGVTWGTYVAGSPGCGRALQLTGSHQFELLSPVTPSKHWTLVARFQGLPFPGVGKENLFTLVKGSTKTPTQLPIIAYWESPEILRLGMSTRGQGCLTIPGYNLKADAATGWHSIAAVGSNGKTKYYVDGILRGTIDAQVTTAIKYIGADPTNSATRFADMLDDIRIYDYALADEAIASLHSP